MSAEAPAVADDPLIGRKVGGYAITRRIGQGGMGVVYEAQHVMMDKRAAVKVLHREVSADKKLLQRFLNEAKASSAAHHSSIVSIFEYGQLDDGTAFIMMEFLDGEPLLVRMERALSAGKLMPLRLVVELSRQLAAALAVIHQKGIIHRDLKPENIFVVPDSVATLGERVKLLDFGIAKVLDGKARKTTVGMILGTPLYMSPEQCEGSEELDAKVDVYALGVLMYEMVCGHLPFVADTAAALMRQHMFKEPPPLEEQVLDLLPDVCSLIHSMLAKPSAERPTMLEVGEKLEAILPQLGLQASGPHAIIPGPTGGRRRQISIGGGSVGNTDPFANTMGGASESTPFPVSVKTSQPEAFAETMAGHERDSDGKGKLERDSKSKLEPISTPQPVNNTASQSLSAKRARLPILITGVLAMALTLAIGLLVTHGKPVEPHTVSTNTTPLQNPTGTAPIANPPPANPPAKPAASPSVPSTVSETDGEEGPDERPGKGKSKRSKSRSGKKKIEEPASEAGKKAPAHAGHGPADGEADVWR